MSTKKDDRARVWTFILYPDSAPEDWREVISSWHVPACASPLHQYDKNPDGSPKNRIGMCLSSLTGTNRYSRLML